jgi:hypothetical protein
MSATAWPELGGRELRYLDHTWELTGDVDVRRDGELLAVDAVQVDDVRRPTATLYFEVDDGGPSLNPGALGEHFDHLEPDGGDHRLVVKKDGRRYEYALRRLERG